MGLWKIDNVNREEWERREMRRHNIRQWVITLVQLALIAGAVLVIVWLCQEAHP